MYDPHRDLYAVLGVTAVALPGEIRSAICRQYATVRVQDLEEASRRLLITPLRLHYDLQRLTYRATAFLRRLWRSVLLAPLVERARSYLDQRHASRR